MVDRFPARAALTLLALALTGCGSRGGNGAHTGGNDAAPAAASDAGGGNLAVGYSTTEYGIVRAMLNLAQVNADDVVMDLGSGDGRIPILAAKEKGARGIGVELDPHRIQESNANATREGVGTRVEFHQQDLFVTRLNDVTVLTLYLLPEINLQLRPKILAQMRPGARVVSNSFDMGDWRPDRQDTVGGTNIFLWIIPARVEGSWRMEVSNAAPATLQLAQQFQQVTGSSDMGGSRSEISNGRVNGNRISFQIGNRSFEGVVDGDSITGEGWRATRVG
jgi:Methyltransferase domain